MHELVDRLRKSKVAVFSLRIFADSGGWGGQRVLFMSTGRPGEILRKGFN
jgi:hypothetical protein